MRRFGWIAAVAGAIFACGCSQVHYTSPERYERGLVMCLSGAGGMMGEVDRIRDGLASGGVGYAIEGFDWSRGEVLGDQMDVAENHRLASQLAARVATYAKNHPGRPIHLVGISAGTGLIVWALEELPGDQVTDAVLLASSLDARYDLSQALRNVKGHIYCFTSVADSILALGVTWAGTVDRGGGVAGGLVGFSPPDHASDDTKRLYQEKLKQFPWNPGEMLLGHLGDHLGATSPTFVRVRIAPLVLGQEPEQPPRPQSRRTARPVVRDSLYYRARAPDTQAARPAGTWKSLP